MNAANAALAAQLVDAAYVDQAVQARRSTEQKLKELLSQRKIPEAGWDEAAIQLLLRELAHMDSNNFPGNCGVGEREARVYSPLVAARNFHFGHGIGRSGDVAAVQPKAAGSSLMVKLTNYMACDALRLAGWSNVKEAMVLPTATGLTLTLVLLALKAARGAAATHVVWPRIDQKTCLKCIVTAGLIPVVVPQRLDGDELRTDVEAVAATIERLGADSVVCVLSTTSCFAPRAQDSVEELARLASSAGVGHVVNNAYGVQTRKCMGALAGACSAGRVDAVVQSTDKNFMVPVGGAIMAVGKPPKPPKGTRGPAAGGKGPNLLEAVSKLYPGRASNAPLLDLFITLLGMGRGGFSGLLESRTEVMAYLREELGKVAEAEGERVLATKHNDISIAMTLSTFGEAAGTSALGAMLYSRNVSGARVCTGVGRKTVAGIEFEGYGAHADAYAHGPYLTAAAAIGITRLGVEQFVVRLRNTIADFRKQAAAAATEEQ